VDRWKGFTAVLRTFPAHLRTELAMAVLLPCTFLSAQFATPDAGLHHRTKHSHVLAGAPDHEPGCRLAYVCAVHAATDALAHIHGLGRASIGAGGAHHRTEHGVPRGCSERLIENVNVGVKFDHFVDGHGLACFSRLGRAVRSTPTRQQRSDKALARSVAGLSPARAREVSSQRDLGILAHWPWWQIDPGSYGSKVP
jgi:hypothetical protein